MNGAGPRFSRAGFVDHHTYADHMKEKLQTQIIGADALTSVATTPYASWENISAELERLTFELDTLIYRLSHDFNAPLSSVLGLIDLMEMEGGSLNGSENYLHLMRGRIFRMRDIIRDLVYSSRIQNQLALMETADLQTMVEREIMELRDLTNYDRVKVTIKVAGACPARTDLFRFRILINCLISNGINYANLIRKNPWVKIRIGCKADNLEIKVSDNGIGIPCDQKARVFEMFYRGTHTSNGSGLGLYLVHKAVHQLGGKLKLKSAVGEGTEFTITLPNHPPEPM